MRKEKQLLLDDLSEQIKASPNFIVARYDAVTANQANKLRCAIAEMGGDFEIVKKRVFFKTAEALGIELPSTDIDGHIGLIFLRSDVVGTIKAMFNASKEDGLKLDAVLGQYENQIITSEQIEKLSKLPDLDTMRAQLLSVLTAPMSQTLSTINAILTSIPHCLENKANQ